jgi:hypothetical protein
MRLAKTLIWMASFLSVVIFACESRAAVVSTPGNYAYGKILEGGGSNYTFYDMGNAKGSCWNGTIRPVIGTYHLNPTLVEAQLRQMYKSGQKKIALFLWYAPIANAAAILNAPQVPAPPCNDATPLSQVINVYEHVVNSFGGVLSTQHQQNLQAILRLVKKIGFNQVTLRFAQQGGADPSSATTGYWNGWNESQYQENLNFIINTRSLMENELSGSSIKRLYDLGVELGGVTASQASTYTLRLWGDYFNRFGKADSYGFSVAAARGRMTQLIQTFNAVGVRPDLYAVDTYGEGQGDEVDSVLAYTYDELNKMGERLKPLIIQETYANSPSVAQRIISVLNTYPLIIQNIQQWPVYSWDLKTNLTPPSQYNAYGGSVVPTGTITANSCTLPLGQSLCSSQINWSSSNATNVSVYVNGSLMASLPSGTVLAPWIGPTIADFQLRSDQGLLDEVKISALPTGTPMLDPLGAELNGNAFQSISASGFNLQSGCTIGIFTPDWSAVNLIGGNAALLAQISNANCAGSSVSFDIPAWIQTQYKAINFNVSNTNGKWSNPVFVSIDRPKPVIYKAGLGGNQLQSIWATTSNVSSGCTVGIFTPDWSAVNLSAANPALLASVSIVNCQTNSITLEIPQWIRQKYSAINFNVSNSYGKWSEPYLITIR